jgi:alkylation response protein AidB-like acyl-CoA dehydrogenase
MEAMRDKGLYRMWRPKALGGMEVDPVTGFRVFEEVSRIDSAAGWNLQLSSAVEYFGAWFTEKGARDIWGDPNAMVHGAFNPMRKAVVEDGDYRVSGQTPFVSGAHHATSFAGLATVHDGTTMRVDDAGNPEVIMTVCPSSEGEIIDNWDTMGMRGTGSHDVKWDDVFVPRDHTASWVPLEKAGPAYEAPMYRMTIWPPVAALAPPALGIAQAALDDTIALATRKTPAYLTKTLKDRPVVHRQLALAQGELDSGRAYLFDVFNRLYERVEAGHWLNQEDKAHAQLAATHTIQAAASSIRKIHEIVGASGIRNAYRFQRYFRDVHVITQHGFTNMAKLESVGQILLGLEPEWPFMSF